MLFYLDLETFNFVFLYSCSKKNEAGLQERIAAILNTAGFRSAQGQMLLASMLVVEEAAKAKKSLEADFNGGKVFIECKRLKGLKESTIELQVGTARFHADSVFSPANYSETVRDRLVDCIEALCSLPGFQLGFSFSLAKDERERAYREWLDACTESGWVSLDKMIREGWLMLYSLCVGPHYVSTHGEQVFNSCPTWRRVTPRRDVVCMFFENFLAYPVGREISYVSEAYAHLGQAIA
jgi:hypothetical protein